MNEKHKARTFITHVGARRAGVLLVLCVLSVAGCNDEDPEAPDSGSAGKPAPMGGPLPPKPEVRLTPPDRTTNVSATDLALVVESVSAIDDAALQRLAGLVHLSTSDKTVEFESTISTQKTAAGTLGRVQLKPKTTLQPGWYLVDVDPLGDTMRWPAYPELTIAGDGKASSRFRIGSEPSVASIWVCAKDGGKTSLILNLSERARLSSKIGEQVKVTGADGCSVSESAGSEAAEISVSCASLAATGDVKVSLQSAFTSLSDANAPIGGATAEFTFAADKLPAWTEGCKIFRP